MNKFSGIITDIHSEGKINSILIEKCSAKVQVITLELDGNFKVGDTVKVVFRASDVALTKLENDVFSENKILGNVVSLDSGKLMGRVKIESDIGPISSVITTKSISDNNIEVGMQLYATFKATSVSLVG